MRRVRLLLLALVSAAVVVGLVTSFRSRAPVPPDPGWHRDVHATTFWVGEVFDPSAPDGTQVISTYDGRWYQHFGGCDGVIVGGVCRTERRMPGNGWFPRHMTPKENPFYLDLPYDDVNDPAGFRDRCQVIPWAAAPAFAGRCGDRSFSFMKNQWVEIVGPSGRRCFGQIQDAGPGTYHDVAYVFGSPPAPPANQRYGGAGLDVSPALNGCLGFRALDGTMDTVRWRFVPERSVAPGPWLRVVTRRGVS